MELRSSPTPIESDLLPAQGKLVLIAEDEDSNFIVLDMILRKTFKANIIRAKNGREAVDLAKEHSDVDLIIMDIKMPEMDGLEATKLIKKFNNNVPIIAITAFAMSGDEHKAIEAGCDAYLPKPISRSDLYNKLAVYGFVA
jgi:CheY-like chemotaxis protein